MSYFKIRHSFILSVVQLCAFQFFLNKLNDCLVVIFSVHVISCIVITALPPCVAGSITFTFNKDTRKHYMHHNNLMMIYD